MTEAESRTGDAAAATAGASPQPLPRAAVAAAGLGWRVARGAFVVLAGLTLAGAVLPVFFAWTGKLVLDELTRGPDADVARALGWAAAGAAAAALTTVATQLAAYVSKVIEQAVGAAVEDSLCERVNTLVGLSRLEDPAFNNRLQLAERAAQETPSTLLPTMFSLAQAMLRITGYLGVLFAIWPPMAAVLLAAAMPELLARLRLARREVRMTTAVIHTERRRAFYRFLLSDLAAAKEIRLFGLSRFFRERMAATRAYAFGVERRLVRHDAASQSGFAWVTALITAIASLVAIVGVTQGRATVGDFGLFLAAVAGVQASLSTISFQLGDTAKSLKLFGHYLDVVEACDDLASGHGPAPPLTSGIELRDVWFRYRPDLPWVLRGVSMSIPAGHSTGLVGLNGAGKSTLVKLLCRFYDPEHGQILWDGKDLRNLDVVGLRHQITATFQDYMTYDLTVAENIGVGDIARLDDATRVVEAADLARIDEAIRDLPDGYRTMLSRIFFADEDESAGVALSGGQLQRVALARSLMRKDAQLVVLDEPSAGLDPEAEYEIHRALKSHRDGRTSLLISHRLGALRDADQIVVLADGQAAERGTHDELMATDGEYARLFTLQSANYRDQAAVAPA